MIKKKYIFIINLYLETSLSFKIYNLIRALNYNANNYYGQMQEEIIKKDDQLFSSSSISDSYYEPSLFNLA